MIELGHGWYLDAEDGSYEICKTKEYKGKTVKNNSKYYASLSGALNCFYRLVLNEKVANECNSLQDILDCIKKCEAEIQRIVEKHFPNEVI